MNPNSFFEAAYAGHDIVRTDFILENVFSYLVRDIYNFTALNPMNKKEKDVFEGLTLPHIHVSEGEPTAVIFKAVCIAQNSPVLMKDDIEWTATEIVLKLFQMGVLMLLLIINLLCPKKRDEFHNISLTP